MTDTAQLRHSRSSNGRRPVLVLVLVAVASALAVFGAAPAFAQDAAVSSSKKCVRPRGKLQFSADKEDIQSLLRRISQITCRNFIVSEDVKGKSDITIISHQPVTVDQAYAAFLAALEANNMALVRAGQYYKVVERKDAAKQALPMYEKTEDLPWTDAQVTLLYELKYANKDVIQPLLRNLMSKSGDLQVIGGGLLIITDAASNIRRLTKILEKIDVAGSSSRMHIVDIQWAEAQQVAQKLQEIFSNTTTKGKAAPATTRPRARANPEGGNPAGGAADSEIAEDVSIDKIVADERTNKLIIISSLRAFRSIKEVIDILDVPQGDARGTGTQVFVHPLNNADAQKIASTLSNLAQGAQQRRQTAQKGKPAAAKQAESAELFEGEIKVTADEATNALVIVASPRDYNALKPVIAELDARRPQVFVEAAIMEVGVNQDRRVSLDAYTGLPATVPGLGTGLGVIANEGGKNLIVSSAQTVATRTIFEQLLESGRTIDPTQLAGIVDPAAAFESLLGVIAFQGPAVPGSEDIFGFAVPSFGFVLNALQSNANVNVLSTPHIMTTDNEKAEISVGQRVPVVRGIAPITSGTQFGFGGLQQVAYEDVKLQFTVTPHVNVDNEVRIELEQEVADLGGNVPVGGGLEQPIILNRSAKTTVVVGDQQTVVIGGLISDRESDSESKIPLLGDIPLIGWLFKNWSDQKAKTNLVLVLTPYVVRDESDFQKIYARKIQERRQFLETYYGYAQEYNPYIDYDKKTGPLGRLVGDVNRELTKIENGGPGLPGEQLITPEASITPLGEVTGEEGVGGPVVEGSEIENGGEAPADDSGAGEGIPDEGASDQGVE